MSLDSLIDMKGQTDMVIPIYSRTLCLRGYKRFRVGNKKVQVSWIIGTSHIFYMALDLFQCCYSIQSGKFQFFIFVISVIFHILSYSK